MACVAPRRDGAKNVIRRLEKHNAMWMVSPPPSSSARLQKSYRKFKSHGQIMGYLVVYADD
eukprot:657806-Lingulodinium_polyedra.AAC.1